MYRYLLDDIAVADLARADMAYVSYFAGLGEYDKGVRWAERFFLDYQTEINRLKEDPYRHSICNIYPFNQMETSYRSFVCGWFTVFYTVNKDSFTVWYVRGSKANFSILKNR